MTVRVDALSSSTLAPQQPITWFKVDINTLSFNQVGAFTLVLPATERNWQLVTFDAQGEFLPVALLADWNGVFQVPLLAEQWEHDLTVDAATGIITETITLSGADFLALLANRVCYPDGTLHWTAQTTIPRTVTGPAETVIKTLVTENTITAADTARRIPNFSVATDQGRGGTVSYTITPPLPSQGSNLMDGDAASFENSLANWSGTNCSIARSADHAHGGSHSMKMTSSSAGAMNAVSCTAATIVANGMQVRPGDAVTATAWFRAASTVRNCTIGADWYDGSGTLLSSDTSGTVTDSGNKWVQVTGSFSAPDNAALARLNAAVANSSAGEVHYVDSTSFTDNGLQETGSSSTSNLGDSLMDMIRAVAAQSQIGVQVTLTGGQLMFDCYIPRDLSRQAVFATSLGNLRGDSISDAVPTADVILLEDGHAAPNFTEQDAFGSAAADPWRRAEQFDDQTSTTKTADVNAAAVADQQQGAAVHQLIITATDIPKLRFGKTAGNVQGYGLGDTVTVSIRAGVAYTDVVSAVQLTAGSDTAGSVFSAAATGVQAGGGSGAYYEQVTPTIGTPSASDTDRSAIRRLTAKVRRIDKAVARARKAGQ